MLVTFVDINDPTTVQRVDPDNLAATFGPGVSLKRITLEITDEKVMAGGIRKIVPWVSGSPEPRLGPATGGIQNIPFYRAVSHGDFLRD
jgi:hypothetical protein